MNEHKFYGRACVLFSSLFIYVFYYQVGREIVLVLFGLTYMSIIMFALTHWMTTKEMIQIIWYNLKNV